MFASIGKFFHSLFTHNVKTVASAIAPLTKIQADLKEIHATASADVAAAHTAIEAKVAQIETHSATMDAAAAHLAGVTGATAAWIAAGRDPSVMK